MRRRPTALVSRGRSFGGISAAAIFGGVGVGGGAGIVPPDGTDALGVAPPSLRLLSGHPSSAADASSTSGVGAGTAAPVTVAGVLPIPGEGPTALPRHEVLVLRGYDDDDGDGDDANGSGDASGDAVDASAEMPATGGRLEGGGAGARPGLGPGGDVGYRKRSDSGAAALLSLAGPLSPPVAVPLPPPVAVPLPTPSAAAAPLIFTPQAMQAAAAAVAPPPTAPAPSAAAGRRLGENLEQAQRRARALLKNRPYSSVNSSASASRPSSSSSSSSPAFGHSGNGPAAVIAATKNVNGRSGHLFRDPPSMEADRPTPTSAPAPASLAWPDAEGAMLAAARAPSSRPEAERGDDRADVDTAASSSSFEGRSTNDRTTKKRSSKKKNFQHVMDFAAGLALRRRVIVPVLRERDEATRRWFRSEMEGAAVAAMAGKCGAKSKQVWRNMDGRNRPRSPTVAAAATANMSAAWEGNITEGYHKEGNGNEGNAAAEFLSSVGRGEAALLERVAAAAELSSSLDSADGEVVRASISLVEAADATVLRRWYENGGDMLLPGMSRRWSEWWCRMCNAPDPGCEMIKLVVRRGSSKEEKDGGKDPGRKEDGRDGDANDREGGVILGVAYYERNVVDRIRCADPPGDEGGDGGGAQCGGASSNLGIDATKSQNGAGRERSLGKKPVQYGAADDAGGGGVFSDTEEDKAELRKRTVRTTLLRGLRINPRFNPEVARRSHPLKFLCGNKNDEEECNGGGGLHHRLVVAYRGAPAALVSAVLLRSLVFGTEALGVNCPKNDALEDFYGRLLGAFDKEEEEGEAKEEDQQIGIELNGALPPPGAPECVSSHDGRRYYRVSASRRWDILQHVFGHQLKLWERLRSEGGTSSADGENCGGGGGGEPPCLGQLLGFGRGIGEANGENRLVAAAADRSGVKAFLASGDDNVIERNGIRYGGGAVHRLTNSEAQLENRKDKWEHFPDTGRAETKKRALNGCPADGDTFQGPAPLSQKRARLSADSGTTGVAMATGPPDREARREICVSGSVRVKREKDGSPGIRFGRGSMDERTMACEV